MLKVWKNKLQSLCYWLISNQLWIWIWTIHILFCLCAIFRRAESPFGSGSARGGEGVPTGSSQAGWWRNAHPGIYCQIQNSKWAVLNQCSLAREQTNTRGKRLFSDALFRFRGVIKHYIHNYSKGRVRENINKKLIHFIQHWHIQMIKRDSKKSYFEL